MDHANVPSQDVGLRKVTPFLAAVVSLNVLLQVVSHWHVFGMLSRSLAITLVTGLIVLPVNFVRAQRRGIPLGQYQLLTTTYFLLLLATMLFAVRY